MHEYSALNRLVDCKYILAILLSQIEFNRKYIFSYSKLDLASAILICCQNLLLFDCILILFNENTNFRINQILKT